MSRFFPVLIIWASAACMTVLPNISFSQGLTSVVYKKPEPYGGAEQWKNYLKKAMRYPDSSMKNGVEGEVEFHFIVSDQGDVRDVKMMHDLSLEIQEEAERLFHKIEWIPAIYQDSYYESEATFKIKFDIKKYQKWCKKRGYVEAPEFEDRESESFRVYEEQELDKLPVCILKKKDMRLEHFLLENLRYPAEAYSRGLEGYVIMSFVIEPDGLVSNIHAETPLGGGCVAEATRLIGLLTWEPGRLNNERVRTRKNVRIDFQLPVDQ